jgi:hypothetical protein
MAYSPHDKVMYCPHCGQNTELLSTPKHIQEEQKKTPIQLPDLDTRYSTVDNKTLDEPDPSSSFSIEIPILDSNEFLSKSRRALLFLD